MHQGSDSEATVSSTSSTSLTNCHESSPPVRRRPIPRKGHTKSRAGCSTCKRRKVKCDETSPECGPCHRLGLHCAYLQRVRDGDDEHIPTSATTLVRSLRSDPMTFTMDDMRFFQHFLFAAYPSLPIDGWAVWQYVSQMSYQFDFLIHSMLALGASHLSLVTPGDYSQASLSHRVIAIQSLNEFLSNAHLSHVNADAAFATMLALTFQASHMPDGLIEWLTMVRGCYLVGSHALLNYEESAFKTFEREHYLAKVMELVVTDGIDSCLGSEISAGFCSSAKRLATLCSSIVEIEYLAMMQQIVRGAANERETSYYVHVHTKMYDRLGELSAAEFAAFIDPQNYAARLVIIHMLAVDFIMSRRLPLDGSKILHFIGLHQGYDFRKAMSVVWIEDVMDRLPEEFYEYGRWVLEFVRRFMGTISLDGIVWQSSLMYAEQPGVKLISPAT